MKIIISPVFDAFYYSFYLQGVHDAFPDHGISFSVQPFPSFTEKCLAFIISDGTTANNIIIDCTDGSEIRPKELAWCDIYGKVNLNLADLPNENAGKVVPIGPSFGINIWSPLKSWYLSCGNLIKAFNKISNSKEHIANYRRQYKYRLPISSFSPSEVSQSDYIFHLSSLWKNDPVTNSNRALFIDVCRQLSDTSSLTFEGGFAPLLPGHPVSGFDGMVHERRYPLSEWMEKTRRSCVVFNTPAVYSCHGWKLPEYLALGKAIISTPLARELPAPLIHGQHIHYVEADQDEIKSAIDRISSDHEYRQNLEHNARAYFDEHLRPDRVIKRLVDKI